MNHFDKTPLHILEYVKNLCLKSLDSPDPDTAIKRTVGTVISTIIVKGHITDCLNAVIQHLDSSNQSTVEV